LSPSQLEALSSGSPSDAVDSAFIYSGAPFSDNGTQLTATPAVSSTPEPASLALAGIGMLALISFGVSARRQ
jgi:hypothetical protein